MIKSCISSMKYNVTVLNGSGSMINWYPDKTPNEIYQFVQFNKLQDNLIISDKQGNKYSVKEFLNGHISFMIILQGE